MGRKRRRHTSRPRQDPLGDLVQDLLGEVRQTLVQGVRQILLPPPPTVSFMFDGQQDPYAKLRKNPLPQPEPDAKPAQVIAIRTDK